MVFVVYESWITCRLKMIYGICVFDLIFKDDNSKSDFVYYCFVLGGGLLFVTGIVHS